MRKHKVLGFGLVILITFLLMPINVLAFCSSVDYNAEQTKLLRIAANVNLNSIHHETEGDISFDIRINNLHEKIKILEFEEDDFIYFYQTNNRNQYVIKGYETDQIVQFAVYPNNPSCIPEDELLLVKRIILPPYNKYYKDPLCEGRSDMPICFRWQRVSLERDEFETVMRRYLAEEQEVDENDQDTLDVFSLFSLIFEYSQYLLYGLVIALLIFMIVLFRRKKKDDFRL